MSCPMPKKVKNISSRPPLARMLRLHEELRGGKYPNCRKLSEELEVSSKTIQRDIDFMRDQLGLPIEYHPERFGFYYTEAVTNFPTVQVTEGELLALFVAQQALAHYRTTPFEEPLKAAFQKLTEGLQDHVSFRISDWESFFSFRSASAALPDLDLFHAVSRAVMHSEEIEFEYRKLNQAEYEWRKIEPYHLGCIDNQWYVFGQDQKRQDVRTFVLPRIRQVRSTGRKFFRPPDFSVAKILAGSFGVYSSDASYEVRIRFNSFAARLVQEKIWHPSQELKELKNGGLELKLQLGSLPEIERWILSWGEHAEVLGPAVLRRRVAKAAAEMAAAYAEGRSR